MKFRYYIYKLAKLFGIEYFRIIYFEKDLKEEFERVEAKIPIEIREVGEKEIDEILFLSGESVKKKIQEYRRFGGRVLAAYHKCEIAGYIFFSHKYIIISGKKIADLKNNGIFTYGGFVFEKFRRNKVFEKIVERHFRIARSEGFAYSANFVEAGNIPAMKTRERFQAKKKKLVIIFLPFGFKLVLGRPIGEGDLV